MLKNNFIKIKIIISLAFLCTFSACEKKETLNLESKPNYPHINNKNGYIEEIELPKGFNSFTKHEKIEYLSKIQIEKIEKSNQNDWIFVLGSGNAPKELERISQNLNSQEKEKLIVLDKSEDMIQPDPKKGTNFIHYDIMKLSELSNRIGKKFSKLIFDSAVLKCFPLQGLHIRNSLKPLLVDNGKLYMPFSISMISDHPEIRANEEQKLLVKKLEKDTSINEESPILDIANAINKMNLTKKEKGSIGLLDSSNKGAAIFQEYSTSILIPLGLGDDNRKFVKKIFKAIAFINNFEMLKFIFGNVEVKQDSYPIKTNYQIDIYFEITNNSK